MFFGCKHVETGPNCSHELITFLKYHMTLICIFLIKRRGKSKRKKMAREPKANFINLNKSYTEKKMLLNQKHVYYEFIKIYHKNQSICY